MAELLAVFPSPPHRTWFAAPSKVPRSHTWRLVFTVGNWMVCAPSMAAGSGAKWTVSAAFVGMRSVPDQFARFVIEYVPAAVGTQAAVTPASVASAPSPKTPAHHPSAHAHTSVRTFQFLVTFIMCSPLRCRLRIDLFHSVYKSIIRTPPPVNCEF